MLPFLIFCIALLSINGICSILQWRYGENVRMLWIKNEKCLCVKCFRKHSTTVLILVAMLLLVAIILTTSINHAIKETNCKTVVQAVFMVVAFCAVTLKLLQIYMSGQVLLMGPKGLLLIIPGAFVSVSWWHKLNYSRLGSRVFAMEWNGALRMPLKSVCDWEWSDVENKLVLLLNYTESHKSKVIFTFPPLSDAEREEMVDMLDSMNRE